jgi:hypothetical protein
MRVAAAYGSTPLETAATASVPDRLSLVLGVAPLIALFVVLERVLMAATRLPEASYFAPSIAAELARYALAHGGALALAASIAALAALRGPLLWRRWSDLDRGGLLRVVIGGLALAFAWTFASYEPNFYFARTHAVDRALLIALALLGCWRPVFLLAFTPLLLAVVWQFEYPLGGYSWTDKSAPLRVLLLFLAWFVWLAITRGRRVEPFLFAACALTASHYWIPGLEKLRLGWLAHGNLHHLTLAAWQNGWLAGLDAPAIASFAGRLAIGEPLSLGFTIAAEAGALLMMLRRRVALSLLAAWMLLHATIFAVSGICFWKWVMLDAGLFALIVSLDRAASARIFGTVPLLVSLVLITSALHWCRPVRLGWYDTRVADTYQYTVIGDSGAAYRIAPSFFAPYDLSVAQNRFGYLSRHPTLVSTYGMTQNPTIAEHLLGARTRAEVEALEARFGAPQRDERKAERFHEFARRALVAKSGPDRARPWYTALHPPLHIWTSSREPHYTGEDPARRLLVDRVTTLWDGAQLREIRVERVREIATDSARPEPPATGLAGP